MRHCRWCGTTDAINFYASNKARYCRECWTKKYVLKGRDRAIDAKLRISKCMDCEMLVTENNHYLFDFDHRPGEIKLYNVARMRTASDRKFREEIAKCDLVCLFCHRERTMRRLREMKILRAEKERANGVFVDGDSDRTSSDNERLDLDGSVKVAR